MLKPKIGIRPVIDGRWGGVRESLEEKNNEYGKGGGAEAAQFLWIQTIKYVRTTELFSIENVNISTIFLVKMQNSVIAF